MNKATARNVFLALGTWSVAQMLVVPFTFLFSPRGISFSGDLGVVLLWVWLGLPRLLSAIVAANTLVWVTDTRKPLSWLLGLSALYLYSEGMHAWGQLRRAWHVPRTIPDDAGIAIAAIIPAFVCLLIGFWRKKRFADKEFGAR